MPNHTVSLLDFPLSSPGAEGDTPRFDAAMAYCREHPGTTLLVPPGEYRITSPLARDTMRKALSGELGHNPQDVMFTPHFPYTQGISFSGQKGTTLLGYGATLMVEGFMEPVSIRDCSDVTLKGITIDHLRKPYSWGLVTAVTPREDGFFDLAVTLDAACPVEAGTPVDLRYVLYSSHTNLYFIPEAQSVTVADAHTLLVVAGGDRHPETGEPYLGMEFYTLHAFHSRPAILIEQAQNTRLEDVTIHSQPGMGIVGNRSENIWISRLSVVPSAGHHYSTNTDATHFTSITGLLRLEYSNFDGQGDDFINVHNYYHTITPVDPYSCYLHTDAKDGTHAQTLDYPDAGDTLELTHRESLAVPQVYTVLEAHPDHNAYRTLVRLDKPLPPDPEHYFLADVTRLPRLEVVGCHARNHFARSILVKTRDVLLEGNTIVDPLGCGIVIAAEPWWCEGVCAEKVIIRRNRIVSTREAWGDTGGIKVMADCPDPTGYPLGNITIEDNIVDCPKCRYGISVRNADGLTLRRNRAVAREEAIHLETCINVTSDL